MVNNEKNPTQQSPASFDPCEQSKRKLDVSNDGIQPGTKFKVIAFDIGQVLLPFDWSEVEDGFAKRTGRSRSEVTEAMLKLQKLGYESGDIDTIGFLQELNRLLSSDITVEEFLVLWNRSFRECQQMIPVVEQLAKTHRLFALSNTNPGHFINLNIVIKIYRHFEYRILSHLVRHTKPETPIFRAVLDYTGRSVRKRDVLFVDDKALFVHAARRYGFKAIQFTTPEDFVFRLKELGLLE